MAGKPRGGDMPNHIEAEESVVGMSGAGEASEDIQELRVYIMQMMHAEMELMESVKQNEDNIATANTRIEKLKELITSEKRRSKEVGKQLTRSSYELRTISDKKMVVEAKYRQYYDTIIQREVECIDLKAKYQHLRRVIENLEASANVLDRLVGKAVDTTQELKKRRSTVLDAMQGDGELDVHRAELQKIRAKKRYIDQHAGQIALEANGLHEQHQTLKQRLVVANEELKEIEANLEGFDIDASRQRHRLLAEIRQIRHLKEQSNKKLVSKQRKYRVKMKGEISTLKKRVTFVSRELEGHEMDVEDTLSSLTPFQDSRNQLETRLTDLEAEIAARQESIRLARGQIDNFDTGKVAFDICPMKSQLEAKNIEVGDAVRNLTALKDKLAELEEGTTRILEEKNRVHCEIDRLSSTDVGEELMKLREELKRLEDQRGTLLEDNKTAHEMLDRTSVQAQNNRQQLKRSKTSTAKQQKELRKVAQQLEQANAKLAMEQATLKRVEEAEKLSARLKSSLQEVKTNNEARLKELERALYDKELEWKRHCREHEARLKMELEAWNEKVQELQLQLA